MHIDYSITTIQQKMNVQSVLDFLSQPHSLRILDKCPQLALKSRNQTIFINIIGARRMSTLNKSYRKKDTSTDVLSFELYENGVMGELYICPDDIEKNARMLKHSFENELLEITIHGMLHLSGYDHSEEMFSWQKRLTDLILKEYENTRRAR
ncbi:rRNA maturation RNase YbeY [bacterium]|nr:rRNA maturation RNase YbeY [bacterium]